LKVPHRLLSPILILSSVIITLSTPSSSHAQGNLGSNSSTVISRQGIPRGGVNIAVCQPLATTAASVAGNLATLTMLSNPLTAGFVPNMTILVAGFTGADTYYNAGTLTNGSIVGGWTILSVSSTSIVFALSHAPASASSNGTVLQIGNGSTPCAALSSIYQDPALTLPAPNPTVSDQLGNWNVFAASGIYDVQFYSASTATTMKVIGVPLPSLTGVATLPGNNILTGNQTITGGQNAINFYTHNNILNVFPSAAYKYTTLEGGIGATECISASCQVNLISGMTETFTSPITINPAGQTNYVEVHGYPNSQLTCNITSGGNCFTFNSQSTMSGDVLGANTGAGTGGFLLTMPSTASIGCLMCVNATAVGGSSYIRWNNLMAQGNPSATVTNAMYDIAGVNNMSEFRNLFTYNYPANTIGVRVRSTANGVAGPLNIENVWSGGNYLAGQRPCVLESITSSVGNINWLGGICNHPASAGVNFELNGHGNTGALSSVNILANYLENFQNGGGIGYKLADVANVNILGSYASLRDTDTVVDISETVAKHTNSILISGLGVGAPTNSATAINNHITGAKFPSAGGWASIPFYTYGCETGCSVMPFTIESNNFEIWDSANHRAVVIPAQSTTGVNPVFNNVVDGQGAFEFNCGLTVAQTCYYGLEELGVEKWRIASVDNAGNFTGAVDVVSGFKSRLKFAPSASVATTANVNLLNTEHIGWRDAGNANDHLLGEVQHIRGVAGCTTAGTLNATCTTLITWPSPFADTNYTATCLATSTFTGTPVLQGEVAASKLAASITVQTINLSAVVSGFSGIDCIAVHD
jgi:hypothetical protein